MFLLLLSCISLVISQDPLSETGNAIFGGQSVTKWPMPVNYWLNEIVKDVFTEAVQWYEKNTCIRFKEFNLSDPVFPNMIIGTQSGYECTSPLGMGVENSYVNLDCAFTPWLAVRTIARSLGFVYEQDRPDRSTYVAFTIPFGAAARTLPVSEEYETFPYDYSSVMHSDPFLGNPFATLPKMLAKENIYQNSMGSARIQGNDIFGINDFYQCLSKCANIPAPACNNGGRQNPNDCTSCVCPPMFTGKLCGQKHPGIRPFNGVSCGETIKATNTTQTHEFRMKTKSTSRDSECYFHIEKTDSNMKIRIILTNYSESVPRHDTRFCESGVQIYSQGTFTHKALTVCAQAQLVDPRNFVQSKTKVVMRMFRSDSENVGSVETVIKFTYRQVV